ncbi:PleD family two-component system response regulator [Pedobacter sp. BAL39]|uniref:response regulator n=1 Tax=Pedobacter sp. BAL39 TaxID=391596 RepID=UPI002100CB09|nr:hypothetical protein [Pedobacter sp. BAL39]
MDKDPAIIDVISIMLKEEGYNVLISQKPFRLEEVKEHTPALILLHHGLSNDGSIICQSIKNCPETKDIPIIMSSTRPDLPILAEINFANAYIQKPFNIDEFLDLIKLSLNS